LIGNNDAHGKNFSLLYTGKTRNVMKTRLSPFYDVVSTAYYTDLSNKMAMKIGGEYVSDKVAPRHFERLAEETGLSKGLVKARIKDLTQRTISQIGTAAITNSVADRVAAVVQERCERVQRLFSA
jgi:serine/threonine-protein kinase HipA